MPQYLWSLYIHVIYQQMPVGCWKYEDMLTWDVSVRLNVANERGLLNLISFTQTQSLCINENSREMDWNVKYWKWFIKNTHMQHVIYCNIELIHMLTFQDESFFFFLSKQAAKNKVNFSELYCVIQWRVIYSILLIY